MYTDPYNTFIGSHYEVFCRGEFIAFYIAAVTPILKKTNLDQLSNFRPISNLTFVSKIMEKDVSFLAQNNTFQSGFRAQHSIETALTKVVNDLLLSGDLGSLTILLLLDLSSAFDTG